MLSNVPADHADAFGAAQPWLYHLDHVAFSGRINAAKPEPAAFHQCVTAMHATPADFLFVDDREENVRGTGRRYDRTCLHRSCRPGRNRQPLAAGRRDVILSDARRAQRGVRKGSILPQPRPSSGFLPEIDNRRTGECVSRCVVQAAGAPKTSQQVSPFIGHFRPYVDRLISARPKEVE
ncbi:hypothetical protein [Streptomyces sp. IBSBF 2435]|uniref:hypothetical protein n=1 Tax=Streptomyces sp. IBSBF 2435 TaxID=2903531 RepID=UPI002FDC39C9